jgi:hypothetical protein
MPKYSLGKAAAVLAAMAVLPVTVAVTDAEAATTTCDFRANKHIVKVAVTDVEGGATFQRSSDDRLLVNADLCLSPMGKAATVFNTRVVRVTGALSEQSVLIDFAGGAFAPGYGDEPGSSDEIEFDVRLGAGTDTVHIAAGDAGVDVRAGTASDGTERLNLDADEAEAIDADVTLRGVETVYFHGGQGDDRFIASGGLGTGRGLAVVAGLDDEVGGNDLLIGGRHADYIRDDSSVVDGDTLRGGPGADYIASYDPDTTGDLVDAGKGNDTCAFNAEDAVLNCEMTPAS